MPPPKRAAQYGINNVARSHRGNHSIEWTNLDFLCASVFTRDYRVDVRIWFAREIKYLGDDRIQEERHRQKQR